MMRQGDQARQVGPILVASLAGCVVLWGLWQPNAVSSGLLEVAQIVVATGLLLGIVNILVFHVRRVVRDRSSRLTSAALVVGLVGVFTVQLAGDYLGGDAAAVALAVLRYGYQPLAESLLALLTVFVVRAIWRAMRLRPGEAWIVTLVSAAFLLGTGPWTGLVPGLLPVLDWVRAYPVVGVVRGLLLGVGIGSVVASLRLLFGFDQPYVDR
ncbi:MAG: hypothetical protein NVSMB42_06920 [Herpetosiphon sp.]